MKKLILMAGAALMVNMSAQATDWLSQYFYNNFDLNNTSLTFTPVGTTNFTVSAETITELPVDLDTPDVNMGAVSTLTLYYNSSIYPIDIANGNFYFFGKYYTSFYLCRGLITFGNANTYPYPWDWNDFYDHPAIGLFFNYWNTQSGGTIRTVRTSKPERFVITFEDVVTDYSSVQCTAQCELFLDDGTIRLSWIDTGTYTYETIVGLSAGQGYDSSYTTTDFSDLLGPVVTPGDVDDDNIPDVWETAHFGSYTNCTAGDDSDLDGFSNYNEYIANTDPTDEDSHFQIQSAYLTGAATPEFVLNWNCQTGRTYSVLWSANPSTGFTPVNTTGITHPQSSFSAPVTGEQGFYKVEVHMTE
jgi:hypothetical protein